ncbi:MAG: bifunctional precorrin-2 dehydrogenase/sirohydrochlorin ferrochelatase [Dehalococcoidia bacterium]|jgi:siroheme synthase-like protein
MNPYYPLFLNVQAKKCTVIGGGLIALRKVNSLLEHRADITVISPYICKGIDDLFARGKIQVLKRKYQAGDLECTFLAVAATGDKGLNKKIVKEAKKNQVLLNVVDDPELSDFIVPSVLHRGDISIAVSTGGKSPALARKIRSRLETHIADEYSALVLLVNDVRTELQQKGIKFSGSAWQDALDLDSMVDLLRKGDNSGARSILLSKLKKSKMKNRE